MTSKTYTAQEMREMANAVDDVSINDNGEYYYEKHDKFNPDLVRDMLRQAADMHERAYAVIAKAKKANETQTSFGCRTCVENYIKEINYILCSDAGRRREITDYSNIGAVCFDCAQKAGLVQKHKIVCAWIGECDICHKQKTCTDLWNDWNPPKTESEVKK